MPIPQSTSPAFQFYPKDFLSSSKVGRMSMTERGVYITLLSHCWLDNGLPDDVSQIAKLAGMKQPQFVRMWAGPLHECFYAKSGRLHNDRLDRERKKQVEFRRRQTDAINKRWEKAKNKDASNTVVSERKARGITLQSPISNLQIASSTPPSEESSAALRASEPAFLTFPTTGKGPKTWDLTEAQCSEWESAYPGLNVRVECQQALAWIRANQSKTAKGMPAFLVNWLNRSVARGGRGPVVNAKVPAWMQ